MRLQPIIPQPTNQYQYGCQINGTGLNQQQLSSPNQHNFFVSPTLGQVNFQGMEPIPSSTQTQQQCLGRVNNAERESTTDDKAEEVKRKLRKRGIAEDNWKYYLESPHTWDYTDVTSSGLCRGVEVVLLSPTTCTPSWIVKESLSRFIQLK